MTLKSKLNNGIDNYKSQFSVTETYTCPGVQLKSNELTFQEPVMFCLNGEPVLSDGRLVSCLVSQGIFENLIFSLNNSVIKVFAIDFPV